jgi:hypothetical protein
MEGSRRIQFFQWTRLRRSERVAPNYHTSCIVLHDDPAIVVSRGVCLIVCLDSLVCSLLYGLGSHPWRPCGRCGVVVLAYDSAGISCYAIYVCVFVCCFCRATLYRAGFVSYRVTVVGDLAVTFHPILYGMLPRMHGGNMLIELHVCEYNCSGLKFVASRCVSVCVVDTSVHFVLTPLLDTNGTRIFY